MGKISRASSSSLSVEVLVVEDLDFVQVDEQGLSHWEFVNASDADSEKEESENEEREVDNSVGDEIGSLGFEPNEQIVTHHVDLDDDHDHQDVGVKYESGHYSSGYGQQRDDEEEEEEEDDDDDGEDDLDDELVPWDVSDKFGRQRLRKLGKRAFPKMYNSKRSPYLFVRPGCVRGKHGMGLKHNF